MIGEHVVLIDDRERHAAGTLIRENERSYWLLTGGQKHAWGKQRWTRLA